MEKAEKKKAEKKKKKAEKEERGWMRRFLSPHILEGWIAKIANYINV